MSFEDFPTNTPMKSGKRPPPKTRVVGYTIYGSFVESAVEAILIRARTKNVVTEFDTGRGEMVWFNGPPGAELRELRKQILQLIQPRKDV